MLPSRRSLVRCMGRTLGAKFSSRSVERFQRPQKLLFAQLQKTSACPSLVVSCPQFDVSHPRANCSGRPNSGDFLSLGDRRLQKQYCQFWLSWVILVCPGSVRTPARATSHHGQTNWFCGSEQPGETMATTTTMTMTMNMTRAMVMGRVQSAPLPAPISLQDLDQTLSLATLKVLS